MTVQMVVEQLLAAGFTQEQAQRAAPDILDLAGHSGGKE